MRKKKESACVCVNHDFVKRLSQIGSGGGGGGGGGGGVVPLSKLTNAQELTTEKTFEITRSTSIAFLNLIYNTF